MTSDRVDFFIVGAMKSGTTSLRSVLGRSPDVDACPREMHFFDNDDNFARGFDWYHAQFGPARPGVRRGEKSPSYGFSAQGAARIADYNPDARILWIFRDPVARAVSNYYHARRRRDDAPALEHAIDNRVALERRNAKTAYVYRSEYQKHLDNFARFPSGQMRILIFEEVLEGARPDIAETFGFLGVRAPAKVGFPHSNEGDAELRESNPVSSATIAELRSLLRPTVEAIEERLGRRIPAWSGA
ncbi:sulfotransferase family protein [Methylopila henanensis]|uniref:Sulfotransferase family protein n=1 Tax=Methylopila henanensis TaxID=873516 RepID=A0ABW4K9C6_9HYPH